MIGKEYGYNENYLIKDGLPWFPMMGEFHFTRYPQKYWKESLDKMKAGGIEVVSSYVFWIHHEEIEGEYDFTGNRNLRAFIDTIKHLKCHCICALDHGATESGYGRIL